ncbi:hypothetical protein [Paenisporosarcina cavernae]|uniref:Phage protein n=1 Tax=Paenisporosarcina cavernae TaxID=2320858 RepID=A0A385YSA8_9BACL|nr:hypothetical protein [Paenisporosarcina cavernae]AYC29659.1 hypothetical protein D3873_07060 [Paenisporosarcina cavernae]
MLKEFVSYLLELKRPETIEAAGKVYSTNQLYRLDTEQKVQPIELRSLSGIVDYIKSNFDHDRKLMIHVESPTRVNVFDSLNDVNDRRSYVAAKALLPEIKFERFIDREQFQIMLQACFVENAHKQQLLKLISSITEENSVQMTDDGLSQRVTAKTGVATVGNVEIPNPVELKPFRTFVEVAQPASEFILRLREGGQVGLFEADGGAWELNAMSNIANYLAQELENEINLQNVYIIE